MTSPNHLTGATAHSVPRRSEDNAASQVLTPGAVAGVAQSVGSAGDTYELEVTTPLARILSHKTAPTAAKPWGNQPLCPTCNRGKLYSCICNVPEPDVMPVEDMMKVMPRLFGLPNGWTRIGPL